MRVFITGGTGYIGSAIVAELRRHGHEVSGLCRSDESARRLEEAGVQPVRGDLKQPSSFTAAAAGHDVWIHTAFEYSEQGVEADRTAIEGLVRAAGESEGGGVLTYTSGVWVLGDTGDVPADETASTEKAADIVAWRPEHERLVLDAGTDELVTAVVRPGVVYGGSRGLVGRMFETAMERGAAEYIGTGTNRWSLVHREDLARLYHTIADGRAAGVFHGVDGEAPRVAEVAEALSEAAGADGRTAAVPLETARQKMGPVADALCLDQVVVTERSAELGWVPERSSILEAADEYFEEWSA